MCSRWRGKRRGLFLPMAFSIISDDFACSIELPLSAGLIEALACQFQRLESGASRGAFQQRLAQHLQPALLEVLDADLKPATDSQIKFGRDIARKLGIEIPSRALQSRAGMQTFISVHLPQLQARTRGGSK